MRRRIKVRDLMQREGLCGEIVELFHSQHTGMIHGDGGYDVIFNGESLVVGLAYNQLSLGLKVSYGFSPTERNIPLPSMCNRHPALDGSAGCRGKRVAQRAGGMGLV